MGIGVRVTAVDGDLTKWRTVTMAAWRGGIMSWGRHLAVGVIRLIIVYNRFNITREYRYFCVCVDLRYRTLDTDSCILAFNVFHLLQDFQGDETLRRPCHKHTHSDCVPRFREFHLLNHATLNPVRYLPTVLLTFFSSFWATFWYRSV